MQCRDNEKSRGLVLAALCCPRSGLIPSPLEGARGGRRRLIHRSLVDSQTPPAPPLKGGRERMVALPLKGGRERMVALPLKGGRKRMVALPLKGGTGADKHKKNRPSTDLWRAYFFLVCYQKVQDTAVQWQLLCHRTRVSYSAAGTTLTKLRSSRPLWNFTTPSTRA